MKPLTRLQILEKQNKELRIRLENKNGKAEIAACEIEGELKLLREQLVIKNETESMLQRELELQSKLLSERIDKAVAAAKAPLLEELAAAYSEIARLKAIINKNSSNSSMPSSKNGFRDVPNSREKSEKSKGGQPGHQGHRLGLPVNLDRLIEEGHVQVRVIDHTDGTEEYISRYVIDMEIITTITEHRYNVGTQLPKEQYNEVTYGDNVKEMSVYLLVEGIIAEDRLSDMIHGLTNGTIMISPATLERYKSRFAEKLESSGELDAIKEDLLNGEVMHVDDTTMRTSQIVQYHDDGTRTLHEEDKKSYRAIIRTHSNENSTLYTINPGKGMDGIKRDGILPGFFGTLSHDHESKFYNYGTRHATCGEHLLRDLKGLLDLERITWARDMRIHIAEMNNHKNKDLASGIKQCNPGILQNFESEYEKLINRGRHELSEMKPGSFGYDAFNAMLNRLTENKDNYLLFIRDYNAPFSNNLSERDLRIEKTKEKVSCLFRSWSGLETHVRIRSFLSTLKKRGMGLYGGIKRVHAGEPVLRKI